MIGRQGPIPPGVRRCDGRRSHTIGRVTANPATPRRYRSIAGLVRVLAPRQLLPFWLAIGLTFAAFGFLIDVTARGRSAPLTLALNVIFSGALAVGYAWTGMTGRRRTFAATMVVHLSYVLIVTRVFRGLAVAPPGRLFVDGLGAMLTLLAGYSLFIRFINSSASRYLRVRTEIELARDIHAVLVPPI